MKQFLKSRRVIWVTTLLFWVYSINGYSQKADAGQIVCFQSQIKDSSVFIGMSGSTFELTDGTNWKLTASNTSYTSYSSRAVLVCPDLGKMFTLNSAFSVEKTAKKAW